MAFGAVFGLGVGAVPAAGVYTSSRDRVMSDAGDEVRAKYSLPDFTEVLQKKLHERLSAEIPNPAKLVLDQTLVDAEFRKTSDGLLTIGSIVHLKDGAGVRSVARIELIDATNHVLWRKDYIYISKDRNRTTDLAALYADDGKALKEEIAYAAQQTVENFLYDFNAGGRGRQ